MKNPGKKVRADLSLAINEHNLIEEWKPQAAWMLDYSIKLADALQERDEARAQLSVVAAELDSAIRANPQEYGVTKTTEGAISAAIPGTAAHKAATKDFNDAYHKVRVMQAAVDALSHRKNTLQGMTDLWMRQYYADPKSPHQPKEVREVPANSKTIPGRRARRGRR